MIKTIVKSVLSLLEAVVLLIGALLFLIVIVFDSKASYKKINDILNGK